MKNRTLQKAVAYSLAAHGLALAMLVMANANAFLPRQTIETVPFITASLIYAMNGHDEQKTAPPVHRPADRIVRTVHQPLEPRPLIDQANKTEPQTLAMVSVREEQTGDRKAEASVSLHLPTLNSADTREIASLGKISGDHSDVGQRSGSSKAESGQMALPRYLNAARPAYPILARMRGYEGMVLLAVLVLKDGRAGEVRIKKTSGHALLDQSALDAVRTWRFEPARKKDTPLAMVVDIPIRFSLQEAD